MYLQITNYNRMGTNFIKNKDIFNEGFFVLLEMLK